MHRPDRAGKEGLQFGERCWVVVTRKVRPAAGKRGRGIGAGRLADSLFADSLAVGRLADSPLGLQYGPDNAAAGVILAFVISRSLAAATVIVLVAAEVAYQPDPLVDDYQLREVIDTENLALARTATEPFTGAVQAYIDDPANTALDQLNESYLRAQLTKLRAEYTIIEGADGDDIRRTIGKIVRRLLEIRHFGDHARELLLELGGEPIGAVDKVIEQLSATLDRIADWADEPEPEQRDTKATIASVNEPATTAAAAADKIGDFGRWAIWPCGLFARRS